MKTLRLLFIVAACALATISSSFAATPDEIRALFLGDNAGHRPADRFKQLQPVMAARGIELTYKDTLDVLHPDYLRGFDCLVIFANHTRISPDQEKALLDFVEKGGGLVPLHCGSYCFLNSEKYIALVGGQFRSHGAGTFKETIVNRDHPIMKGLTEIESWDETYVHTKHNNDRTVLSERRDDKGSEPYTWVRNHGKGRVFYTAWGHDQRTWGNEGFQKLVENGIRWASANSPAQLRVVSDQKPFEYIEAPSPLPNYVPNARWGTQAEPIRTMQKPLSPEASLARAAVFPGFEKALFAHEPEIVKPIWLSWDTKGRLWIAETIDYPNEMQPPGQGRDRIKICEDTNGDGRADKFTIFAENLSVPTSFVFANGGIIVLHSGKSEFLRDTNGDDKADERKDLFVGWGTGDTHAGPSNLRYGFDGWIWGVVGYSGFRGTVGGKEIRFGQGIFRFKPDGSALEFIRSSNNNTWGLGFSEDGTVFGSTANNNASMYMPIPNRYYERVSGWSAARLESIADSQRFYPLTEKVRQVDAHDRYTAGAGSALYTARSFPKEYWNKVKFVTEPTGHLIGKFVLIPKGADYVSHNARSFLASDDEWCSPIAAEVGPDGALWVIDWYNYIIQHNPTPQGFQNGKGNAYETPLRDKTHGRIYRIVHKESRPSAPQKFSTDAELVAALKSDNMLWRSHAQRLIVEGKKNNLVPQLAALVKDQSVDEIGLNTGAVHALWALHGLQSDSPQARQATLDGMNHRSAAVRRAAVATAPASGSSVESALKLLKDDDAQVRLAALLALSEMPASDQVGAAVLAMLQEPRNSEDTWIPDAATVAASRHDSGFLKAALASFRPATPQTQNGAQSAGNLVPNGSFETQADGRPTGWRSVTHNGRGTASVGETGRTGSRSAKLSSEQGADISWAASFDVKPRTDYKLTGWIKTENVQKVGNALGALFNIHELQDPVRGATKPVLGNNDWTMVDLTFNSGNMTQITVNCLLGGWGRATGTAYFDDIEVKPGPGAELAGEVGRVVRMVTRHYAERGPVDSIVPTLVAIKGASESLAVPVLEGLVAGWPRGTAPEVGAAQKKQLTEVMDAMPESVRDRLLALAMRWEKPELFGDRMAQITQGLKERVASSSATDDDRIAASRRLIGLDDSEAAVALVLKQIELVTPPTLGSGLINALTESRNPAIGTAIIGHWENLSPAVRRNAVAAMLRRPDWTGLLLDAVEKGSIARTDVGVDQWAQLKQNQNRMVARRAERLSVVNTAVSADREQIVKELLPLAKQKGDPEKGKAVFTAVCSACHLFNGVGGKVGPDLNGIGSRDPSDILLEILDPNRSVEANYRLWTVTTKAGDTFSGRLETETQTTVEILDTTGQKHVIQRKDISSMQGSALSIMPAGFESLPPEDLKSLIAYLTQPH